MAAGTWTLYNNARGKLVNGTLDLDTNVFRVKLFKGQAAASVSASTLSLLSQIGTTNEAANMSDYTLSAASIKALNGSATYKWSVPNLVITASGGDASSVQYAVVYNSLSAGGGHVLAWCKLSTAAFTVTSGNTLTINAPANGLLVIY
jgi:hypothetical protein